MSRGWWGAVAGLGLLAGCGRPPCADCDTLVIAATAEPTALLPPLVYETVGRDISDQVFERLADLSSGAAPIDPGGYRPGLAARWERIDSLSWRFHLRSGARWQDGGPVTAGDVVFSFQAYSDSVLDTPARSTLAGKILASAEDSSTVLIRFREVYPEQLYDATWHVRIIPAHIWRWIPAAEWAADTAISHLVGSGPYRVRSWQRGQALTLVADSALRPPGPGVRTVIWRFATDPDAALNLVLSHEADLLETLGTPERATRVRADSTLQAISYPSATYGFLGYQLKGDGPLHDLQVRRALNQAVDRATLATTMFGAGTRPPPGPMSQLLWIWDDSIAVLPFDTATARSGLTRAGWSRGPDGILSRRGQRLKFDILVPSSSPVRRRLAEALQEEWRRLGAEVSVTVVEFPVFMERLGRGRFDSYIGTWLDEPSPRGLGDQWTRAGIGALNYGGYASPGFDQAFTGALAATSEAEARARFRVAFDTLNADAPALFLFSPVNVAAASRRLEGLEIDPFSWLSGLRRVRLRPH
jgi:peptide/nickel transport system substrate-binding protein